MKTFLGLLLKISCVSGVFSLVLNSVLPNSPAPSSLKNKSTVFSVVSLSVCTGNLVCIVLTDSVTSTIIVLEFILNDRSVPDTPGISPVLVFEFKYCILPNP